MLRARGDTGVGVGRLRGVIFDTSFLNDSVRAGEEECFGEGVLLEEWPELSTLILPRMKLMIDFFFIRPLPLERCRNSFPTL